MKPKQRPILFSIPMVEAILEGRKTQTRRIAKLQPFEGEYYMQIATDEFVYVSKNAYSGPYQCPFGKVGDILWVRETWGVCSNLPLGTGYIYKADDYPKYMEPCKWKPSIHMPKDACRIFLKITDVRVERLQDISDEDAKAEGVKTEYGSYRHGFIQLWKSINGEESWNANPWVWVIEFERIEKIEIKEK